MEGGKKLVEETTEKLSEESGATEEAGITE